MPTAQSSPALKYTDGNKVNTALTINAASAEYDREFPSGYATMALPFSTSVPSGAAAYTLTSVKTEGSLTVLTLSNSETIEAGKPYIAVVTGSRQMRAASMPVALNGNDVTVAFTPANVNVDGVTMAATFSPVEGSSAIYTLDETGSDRLCGNTDVEPFRTYFALPESLQGNTVELKLEDTPTGVVTLRLTPVDDLVYTVDGRCLGKLTDSELKNLPGGVYIRQRPQVHGRQIRARCTKFVNGRAASFRGNFPELKKERCGHRD